ncbi:MAG TPA: hypothetical protein VKD04_00910 [Burkholderiales bacterium]|nr:hypothetical protein [Burkholderiales bacterium]
MIGAITLAGRQWGPAVAGWLSGFPVVTGPILLFVALEQGPQFGSVTAAGALTGGLAWLSFALSYAWVATKMSWVRALLAGLSSYLLVGIGIVFSAPPFPLVAVMVVVAVALAPLAFPRLTQSIGAAASTSAELIARMLAGGLLTVSVTHLSPLLGPKFSGLFAVFPVMGIVLAAFSHRASGRMFTIHLLRSMVYGFYSFIAFCLTITLGLPAIGIAAGFSLALGFSLSVHFCTLWFMRRARQRRTT